MPKDQESPRSVLDGIWKAWAIDRKKNRATAFVNLQQAYANHHDDIVPDVSTEKEFLSMISDIEQLTKSEQQSESGNPVDVMSEWLRGERELSRVKMEKPQ